MGLNMRGAGNIINIREVRAREVGRTEAMRAVARFSIAILLLAWFGVIASGAAALLQFTSGAINDAAGHIKISIQ